jgi:hypothetical protein
MTSLSSLEQQLAALKAATVQPIQSFAPSNFTLEDIRTMVKDLLVSELSALKTIEQVEDKTITLETALCSILTGDEQKWLLNAENVKRMPAFILTDKGKAITQQFIKEFRSMNGN